MIVAPTHRIGLTFHRTFPLNLPSISQVLDLSCRCGERLTLAAIRDKTALGTVYVDAMPRYARGCGLVELGGYQPTCLGATVHRHDPNLTHPATLWLMHYHMSAPHGPGPEFWSYLVTTRLSFGREVSAPDIAVSLAEYLARQSGERTLQERTVRSSATVFLGSYLKSDGLA